MKAVLSWVLLSALAILAIAPLVFAFKCKDRLWWESDLDGYVTEAAAKRYWCAKEACARDKLCVGKGVKSAELKKWIDGFGCWAWSCVCMCNNGDTVRRWYLLVGDKRDLAGHPRVPISSQTLSNYESWGSVPVEFLPLILPAGVRVLDDSYKFLSEFSRTDGAPLRFFYMDDDIHYSLTNSDDDDPTLSSLSWPTEGKTKWAIYEVLVEVPTNHSSSQLVEEGADVDYYIVSAPAIRDGSAAEGYVLRRLTIAFNVYGLLNAELMGHLATVTDMDEESVIVEVPEVTEQDLINGAHSDGLRRTKSTTKRQGGDYQLNFQSRLTPLQLDYAGQTMYSGLNSVVAAPASAGGMSAGAIAGAVLGSVGGLIVLTAAAGGAFVVGRTIVLRGRVKQTGNQELKVPQSHDWRDGLDRCDISIEVTPLTHKRNQAARWELNWAALPTSPRAAAAEIHAGTWTRMSSCRMNPSPSFPSK